MFACVCASSGSMLCKRGAAMSSHVCVVWESVDVVLPVRVVSFYLVLFVRLFVSLFSVWLPAVADWWQEQHTTYCRSCPTWW